jgi:glycosyltransferase involved in cell wall biosynthesis
MVMPSSYEGFGIVYLEAMSFGLIPVASTQGGAGEIITHGKNGFLITPEEGGASPKKTGNLGAIVEQLQINRDLLEGMSLAAQQSFSDFPTWEGTTASIRTFLTQFLTEWRPNESRGA